AMLTHLGISPKKFWWSRILVFGSVYFAPLVVFAVCLVVYLIYYVYQHGYLPFGETYGDVAREQTVIFFNIVTAYFALFCLGQLVSFLTRSFPIAFVSTLGLCLVPWCWGNFLYWYGIGVFWATMPILIGCLVADWMRGRDTLRSFAVSLSAIAIPFVCVLALIPAVRVYSVPVISLGYKLEIPKDALSPEETKKTCNLTLDRLYAGTGDVAQMRANWQYIQQMIADPKYPMYHHEPGRYASVLFVKIQQDLKDDSLTAEHWKETAAFLEKEMPDMQNMQTWIQQSVERAYGAALYDLNHNRVQSQPVPWHIRLMPWEYARVKRVLANDFQFLPRVAYKQLSLDRGFNTSGQWKYERYLKYRCDNGPQIFSDFYKNARETSDQRQSCNVYDVEQNRSVTMLLCALKCYQMEHGELPETLEQLEGKSIDRLPVTFASRPYKFYRNMDDLSEEQMLEIAEWHPDFRESSFNNSFGSDSGTSPGGMSSSGSSMGAWETRDRIMRFLDNIPPELRGKQFPYFYNRDGSLNEPGRRLLENTSEKIKKLPPQLFDGQRWFPIEFAKEK
ncbi:MAG: hypothetical protein FWC50_00045, partial [Planctomycetaceae bacterium]|nr:hypothetical protein [Planctomycetaceae bacterium]